MTTSAPGNRFRFFDAHNHLQDERFGGDQGALVQLCRQTGVARMVVNGACESDWPQVASLARQFPDLVLPAFGYHPWYLHERTPAWRDCLVHYLDSLPSSVGEIGLDRWKPQLPYQDQEEVFATQLRLAAERNLPASIHCLQAWGRLYDLLRQGPRPARGFLLHSYGGPKELVRPLAALGAYFSLPGYFAHARKGRLRDAFREVPADRLLVETDAPDQPLPAPAEADAALRPALESAIPHPLANPATGRTLNHPANLRAVYHFAATLRGEPVEQLARRIEENFHRLFGADT